MCKRKTVCVRKIKPFFLYLHFHLITYEERERGEMRESDAVCVCEREREGEREEMRESDTMCVCERERKRGNERE